MKSLTRLGRQVFWLIVITLFTTVAYVGFVVWLSW